MTQKSRELFGVIRMLPYRSNSMQDPYNCILVSAYIWKWPRIAKDFFCNSGSLSNVYTDKNEVIKILCTFCNVKSLCYKIIKLSDRVVKKFILLCIVDKVEKN